MLNGREKCLVTLPCYNEERNLKSLIYDIDKTLSHSINYQIIAVNDGSQDRTGGLLKELSNEYPITIVEHKTNKGLSKTLDTGLRTALRCSHDEDFIITMDSDNTHDPKYILPMLRAARQGPDIVIGSRYVPYGRQTHILPHRILLSKMINLLIRRVSKLPVKDATSGYRCFKSSALRKLKKVLEQDFLEAEGFEASFELLVKTYWCGSGVKEIPITLDYSKKNGKSKMKILPTIKRYILAVMKIKEWWKKLEETLEIIDSL